MEEEVPFDKGMGEGSDDEAARVKKNFVLGVVNASEIKCTVARKRRWDQPPEDEPSEKKSCTQDDSSHPATSPAHVQEIIVKEQIIMHNPGLNQLDLNSYPIGSGINELEYVDGNKHVTIEIETVEVTPSDEGVSDNSSNSIIKPGETSEGVRSEHASTDRTKTEREELSEESEGELASLSVSAGPGAEGVDPAVMEVILGTVDRSQPAPSSPSKPPTPPNISSSLETIINKDKEKVPPHSTNSVLICETSSQLQNIETTGQTMSRKSNTTVNSEPLNNDEVKTVADDDDEEFHDCIGPDSDGEGNHPLSSENIPPPPTSPRKVAHIDKLLVPIEEERINKDGTDLLKKEELPLDMPKPSESGSEHCLGEAKVDSVDDCALHTNNRLNPPTSLVSNSSDSPVASIVTSAKGEHSLDTKNSVVPHTSNTQLGESILNFDKTSVVPKSINEASKEQKHPGKSSAKIELVDYAVESDSDEDSGSNTDISPLLNETPTSDKIKPLDTVEELGDKELQTSNVDISIDSCKIALKEDVNKLDVNPEEKVTDNSFVCSQSDRIVESDVNAEDGIEPQESSMALGAVSIKAEHLNSKEVLFVDTRQGNLEDSENAKSINEFAESKMCPGSESEANSASINETDTPSSYTDSVKKEITVADHKTEVSTHFSLEVNTLPTSRLEVNVSTEAEQKVSTDAYSIKSHEKEIMIPDPISVQDNVESKSLSPVRDDAQASSDDHTLVNEAPQVPSTDTVHIRSSETLKNQYATDCGSLAMDEESKVSPTIGEVSLSSEVIENMPMAQEEMSMEHEELPASQTTEKEMTVSSLQDESHTSPVAEEEFCAAVTQVEMPSTPMVQEEMRASPVAQEKMPSSPVAQEEMPTSPVAQEEMPTSTVAQKEMPTSPVPQEKMPTSLVVQEEMPTSSVVQKEMPTSPMEQEETYSPVTAEDKQDPPVIQGENHTSPVPQEETVSPVTEGDKQGPPVIQGKNDTSAVAQEEMPSSPVVQEERGSPVTEGDKQGPPVIQVENDTSPVAQEEIPSSPVVQGESSTSPVAQEDMPTSPVVLEETGSPVREEDKQGPPVIQGENDTSPEAQEEMPTSPVAQDRLLASPIAEKEVPESPETNKDVHMSSIREIDVSPLGTKEEASEVAEGKLESLVSPTVNEEFPGSTITKKKLQTPTLDGNVALSSSPSMRKDHSFSLFDKQGAVSLVSQVTQDIVKCDTASDESGKVVEVTNKNSKNTELEKPPICEINQVHSVPSAASHPEKESNSDSESSGKTVQDSHQIKSEITVSVSEPMEVDSKEDFISDNTESQSEQTSTEVPSVAETENEVRVDNSKPKTVSPIKLKLSPTVYDSDGSVREVGSYSIGKSSSKSDVPLLSVVEGATVNNATAVATTADPPPAAPTGQLAPQPKLEPITLRIFKDNQSLLHADASPKRSPASDSPQQSKQAKKSPSSDNLTQSKQLEFTLKISKDANTKIPKATMSPKGTPVNTWKPEKKLNLPELSITKISPKSNQESQDISCKRASAGIEVNINRVSNVEHGINNIPGGYSDLRSYLLNNSKADSSGVSMTRGTPMRRQGLTPSMLKKGRGRPRKVFSPGDESSSTEMDTSLTASPLAQMNTPSTHRPVRECRDRTKPIVVKRHKPRGGATPSPITRGGGRGSRGGGRGIMPGKDTLSVREQAEIARLEARSEEMRLEKMAKKEAKIARKAAALKRMVAVGNTSTVDPAAAAAALEEKKRLMEEKRKRDQEEEERRRLQREEEEKERLAREEEERAAKEAEKQAKIAARREKLRLNHIAKRDALLAKKALKKLKDEERRKRKAAEKAAEQAAALQSMYEDETRMSAPDFRHPGQFSAGGDESQGSLKRGRMEVSIGPDCKDVGVEQLAEYQWEGSELYMIQEQVAEYLGVKSFKRKYPDLKRRAVDAEERKYLEDSGLVPKAICDLGITAVSSAEILDIMFQDFPDKYEEVRKYLREKQMREITSRQKALSIWRDDKAKADLREQALECAAVWNAQLNRERREERRSCMDLQSLIVHYPESKRQAMKHKTEPLGQYPVSVLPGQYQDHYKQYTSTELMYYPVNTVMYGPLRPNERIQPPVRRRIFATDDAASQSDSSDDENSSDSSSSSGSSSSGSSSSSSSSESGDENPGEAESSTARPAVNEKIKCKICNETKPPPNSLQLNVLLQCSKCKLLCHPGCCNLTALMVPHVRKYNWECPGCKSCAKCSAPHVPDKMVRCDLCDRRFHQSCAGRKPGGLLERQGRWHCPACSFCWLCNAREPGPLDWTHQFAKDEKGGDKFVRSLCTSCRTSGMRVVGSKPLIPGMKQCSVDMGSASAQPLINGQSPASSPLKNIIIRK